MCETRSTAWHAALSVVDIICVRDFAKRTYSTLRNRLSKHTYAESVTPVCVCVPRQPAARGQAAFDGQDSFIRGVVVVGVVLTFASIAYLTRT